MFEEGNILRIPGPTPVPPQVQRAASKPMISHRSDSFRAIMHRVQSGMQKLFQTKSDIAIITGSGTSAMEAAMASLVSPNTPVLVLVGGKFGERWQELAQAYGCDMTVLPYTYGKGVDPADVDEALQANPDIEIVFATQNESSTAVLNDIQGIAEVTNKRDVLLVVDAVSGLGGAPLPMDEWGVDVVVTGSQKCLMLPPGLAFAAASERAWKRMEQAEAPSYYLDLLAYRRSAQKGETPYTPNVSLFFALDEALQAVEREGLDNIFARHLLMRNMVRAGIRALELPLYVDEKWASPTLTAVQTTSTLNVEGLRKVVSSECQVILSGGQGELKGEIFRIGHMGYATPLDMITTLAAIEVGLQRIGYDVELGSGVAAAQEVWTTWLSKY